MVVDDVDGSVHLAYGGLANPTYLIGTDGRVAFYAPTTGAQTLARALSEVGARGGRGIVGGGVDRVPQLLPTLAEGWPALARGRPQSLQDLRTAVPGSVALLRVGHALRPLLGPLTLRAAPLPRWVGPGTVMLVVVVLTAVRSGRRSRRRGGTRGGYGRRA